MVKSKFALSLMIWITFTVVATTLYFTTDNLFYLFNFLYIGTAVSLGIYLMRCGNKYARMSVQAAVGLYMLVYLGIIQHENMMIEGFWYYLFLGLFEAAVIHYLVAKIIGPLLFGRGWCGYACWTAMILDLLPYKIPKSPRLKNLGVLRYATLLLSLIFTVIIVVCYKENSDNIMWIAFIVGNIIYYALGISLAIILKDNRAFCKYICPTAILMKPASYFAMLRIQVDKTKCIDCGACERVCPMNVKLRNPKRSRINGTECILCYECAKICPKKAI
jgi:polyferredoxin